MPGKTWVYGGGDGLGVRGHGERKVRRGTMGRPWENGMIGMEEGWIWKQAKRYLNLEAILGLARDLTLEGFPGVHGDVPS